jgi:ferredoxin
VSARVGFSNEVKISLTDSKPHRITLRPTQVELEASTGAPLRDLLFEQGVEFPCGGQGRCRGCRVRVLEGTAQVNRAQQERLTPEELANGWRLACQARVQGDLKIELAQWEAAILTDESVFAFTPREGLGIAVSKWKSTLPYAMLPESSSPCPQT